LKTNPESTVIPLRQAPLRLMDNLACEMSGLLFDLDYRDDLAPYLHWHPRVGQIQDYPPLLVYADPRHCTGDYMSSHMEASLSGFPQLARGPLDHRRNLRPEILGPGYRKSRSGDEESHRLVLFSSHDPLEPLGFLWLHRKIVASTRSNEIELRFGLRTTYVRPEHRGLGYATALVVAAAICCGWELRYQSERPAVTERVIAPVLEPTEPGCDQLAATMAARIQATIDEVLHRPGRTRSIAEVLDLRH